MNDAGSFTNLETQIKTIVAVPSARPEFVERLYTDLMAKAENKTRFSHRPFYSRPAWIAIFSIIFFLILAVLIVGPQRVAAEVRKLLGYIPNVGLVDRSAPIRVLAEPASLTREGITVSVNSVTLTGNQTLVDYGVAGVPLSAYPQQEAVQACATAEDSPYLRLPDGKKLLLQGRVADPIPPGIQSATFALPCIYNTLPGSVPADWELPLRFIAAPPDLTVLPVIELTPTVLPTETAGTTTTVARTTATVSVRQVIQTETGYILIGEVRSELPQGSWLQETGMPTLQDANGKRVAYTLPNDVQPAVDDNLGPGGFPWVFQIQGAGVAFPLTLHFTGVVISQADPQATAEVKVDAGFNPQPGQDWPINQTVQLGTYSLTLVSIRANPDGYSFRILFGEGLNSADVQIAGYQAVGGGGGGGGGETGSGTSANEYTTSLVYAELPVGSLTILFTNPLTASETETWQGQWQPEVPKTDWPTPTGGSAPVCLRSEALQDLLAPPDGFAGRTLLTQLNPEIRLVLADLDGSVSNVLVQRGSRGALSSDGQRLAYPAADGIRIMELSSGKTTLLSHRVGYSIRWSPDGRQVAFLSNGDVYGIFGVAADGSQERQLTNLYYAIPGAGQAGFQLKAVELASGNIRDLFILEDSSRKAPMPAVSPDGKWVAYRASDNGSLNLLSMDGTQKRLLIQTQATDIAISGIAWSPNGEWIGASLLTPQNPNGDIVLIHWEDCKVYRLANVSGELNGLLIP
jgi:hypothetical protein